ncbi:MAG: lysine--tRNA ligase [Pseudomonadota bacterium]
MTAVHQREEKSESSMWYEKIAEGLAGPQIINDSKTPSGRVHVGSLRGVLVHDAVFRTLQNRGTEVVYQFGIDDYDPLDGLPADATPGLQAHMGYPLCNIPAPPGSPATDLADHYISEFLGIFQELGVAAQVYRMRDVYRSGRFNPAIDAILKKSDVVRRIYAEVSHAVRPEDWHPFQVICENCGRIGTTAVTAYDGHTVAYQCRPDLVRWARGCGHQGRMSPFDGHGKLPWKLEWAAKWQTFGITIEGAGKDHCTRGGSREVAEQCLREIFGGTPPLNVPYEFFLVSGAKMSSSKGVGTAAREIANFLPPEILRFLMIRTPPKRTVNFSTDFEYIVKLFNEHDRLVEATLERDRATREQMLRMIAVNPAATAYHPVGFQLLVALLQLPHLDVEREVDQRTTGGLTESDRVSLRNRLAAARYWLDRYASEEDRIELQTRLPVSASTLSDWQRAFLHRLGEHFPEQPQTEEGYQRFIFDIARLTPIGQHAAFAALYRVLIDKAQGPKGGALLAYLDRAFLVQRFLEIDFSYPAFWRQSAITDSDCEHWLKKHQGQILNTSAGCWLTRGSSGESPGLGIIEIRVTLNDGKTYLLRALLKDFEGEPQNGAAATADLEETGNRWLLALSTNARVKILMTEKTIMVPSN